jgi:hypothetical protein
VLQTQKINLELRVHQQMRLKSFTIFLPEKIEFNISIRFFLNFGIHFNPEL